MDGNTDAQGGSSGPCAGAAAVCPGPGAGSNSAEGGSHEEEGNSVFVLSSRVGMCMCMCMCMCVCVCVCGCVCVRDVYVHVCLPTFQPEAFSVLAYVMSPAKLLKKAIHERLALK